MKPISKTQLVLSWTEHILKVRQLQRTCLLLMQHPEVKPEQLAEAACALQEVMKAHRANVARVRAAWPKFLRFPNIEERIE